MRIQKQFAMRTTSSLRMHLKHFVAIVRYVGWKNESVFEHRQFTVRQVHADAQRLFLVFGRSKPSDNLLQTII